MKYVRGSALFALVAAMALTACSSSDNSSSSSAAASSAPAATDAAATQAPAAGGDGAQAYSANCSSCHQANGQGVAGAFPPLAGNATVTGDPKKVIHIVKYGLTGSITVAGKTFNGTMPPWQTLPDAQIASVITYIRSSWGNSASAVSAADVSSVKR